MWIWRLSSPMNFVSDQCREPCCGSVWVTRLGITRSTIARTNPVGISPEARASVAADKAPQWSCPRTTTRGAPRMSTPYSIEPITVVSTTCPAVRTTNISPRPRSKMISAATRESEHRSEEHTSELQSRGHLVCRLLLEKKKDSRDDGRQPGAL